MKKIISGVSVFFFLIVVSSQLLFASEIRGKVASVDLDVRAMDVKTRNAFTKNESSERLTWTVDSPEGRTLRDLKPGDYVRVDAVKGELGRYLVKKVIKIRKR